MSFLLHTSGSVGALGEQSPGATRTLTACLSDPALFAFAAGVTAPRCQVLAPGRSSRCRLTSI